MNKRIEEKLVLKKSIRKVLNKVLITIIIFLIGMIAVKKNPHLKETLKENVYEKSFKFTKTKNLYEKYFGNILSIDKIIKEVEFRLQDKKITLELTKDAKEFIINSAYDEQYGARPIKRFVARNLETLLAQEIIADHIPFDSKVVIGVKDTQLVIEKIS